MDFNAMSDLVLRVLPSGSWCSRSKATRLATAVFQERPDVAVEIGVFGGDSLFVIAQAMALAKHGIVYGIDPWDRAAAMSGMDPAGDNFRWWSSVNMREVRAGAELKRRAFGLEYRCELVPTRSDDAQTLARFAPGSVGLFHLDGNHGKSECLADVVNWLPKLSSNCVVFFDDVNWVEGGEPTTRDGFEHLLANGFEMSRDDYGMAEMIGDCAIMRRVK